MGHFFPTNKFREHQRSELERTLASTQSVEPQRLRHDWMTKRTHTIQSNSTSLSHFPDDREVTGSPSDPSDKRQSWAGTAKSRVPSELLRPSPEFLQVFVLSHSGREIVAADHGCFPRRPANLNSTSSITYGTYSMGFSCVKGIPSNDSSNYFAAVLGPRPCSGLEDEGAS